MITMELITNQKEILKHDHFFRQLPYVTMTPETMLANCLLGTYGLLAFIENDKSVGIVVFRDQHPKLMIIGLVLKKKTKKFYSYFIDFFKKRNYTELSAISKLPEDRFIGFSRFKKDYTHYSIDLTEEI